MEKLCSVVLILLFCWSLIESHATKGTEMNSIFWINKENHKLLSPVWLRLSVFFSAAWLSFCQNTANTSFKQSWGTTWNKLCVSIASALVINTVQTHQSDLIPLVPRSQLPCILSCGSYSGVSPLVLYYLFPSWSHNHSFVFAAQISGSPLCFSSVV